MQVMQSKENTTSLPMWCLSGPTSKEVSYEDSIGREQRFSVFLSATAASGHEGHFHRPLFCHVAGRGPQWEPPRRWTLDYVIYVSLLMVLDGSQALKDRFSHARQAVVEMFPGRRRPGRTYQGYVKACRRIAGANTCGP